MLSLYDSRSDAVTPVVPARPGQLRTYTAGPPGGPAGLRAYLLADLVRRVGEQHRLRVSAWHSAHDTGEALRADWSALNIHPLDPAPGPPVPLDLTIGSRPAAGEARWLTAAPAGIGGAGEAPATGPYTAAIAARGVDPLALRLALLQRPYREPARLTWADLTAAGQLLTSWRDQVASWANFPSKPMCAQYVTGIKTAFDTDLGTPAALQQVAALACDEDIPPGSRFETFVYLDHLLGLDLASHIGR